MKPKDIFDNDQRSAALQEMGAMFGKMYLAMTAVGVPHEGAVQIVAAFAEGTARRLWSKGDGDEAR